MRSYVYSNTLAGDARKVGVNEATADVFILFTNFAVHAL